MITIKKLKKLYYDFHKNFSRWRVRLSSSQKVKKSSKGKVLSRTQIKEIKEYYKRFNKKINLKYHNFYTEKTGMYYKNYIPDDLYYCYVDMFYNDWNVAAIVDNKCFYHRLLPNVKQPDTFAYRVNEIWYDENFMPTSIDSIRAKLKNVNEIFIKEAYDSAGGHGVTYINSKENMVDKFNKCIEKIEVDIVIQRAIKQNSVLASLNKTSVNTVRILSMLNRDGTVKIYSTIIRMGIDGSKVDNASSGGITCGITDDGTLKSVAYKTNGEKFDKHPTSGIQFDTIKIPKFKEMKELVIKNHPQIPMSRLVSWDLALNDKDEIVLIEVNLKYGELDFHQLNNGPVFGDDTEKILNEVFDK